STLLRPRPIIERNAKDGVVREDARMSTEATHPVNATGATGTAGRAALQGSKRALHAHAGAVAKGSAAAGAHSGGSHTSIASEIQNFAYNWEPVLMIVFFAVIIFVLWRTLKVMPRTKP